MLINKITDHLAARIENGELTNDDLIQLIELVGSYLNLKTIPAYAKETGMSYNGAKNFRKTARIFGVRFVIDNE